MGPTPRPGILEIAPYVGGEARAPGAARLIRLASNENPLGPSPRAIEAYRRQAAELHRYPDGGAEDLRGALGRHWDLDPSRIVVGAGSDELISLITRAYAGAGDEILYSRHGFLMYPIAALTVGATPVAAPERELTADVDQLIAAVNERTRLVFLANPNNPTGSYLPADEVARLHRALRPDILLVIDAAYAEYVQRSDYDSGRALVEAHPNVVMLRTFSKIYGLAGLRLGWAYCPAAIGGVLNRVRGPFNVAGPAQAAGVAALADVAFTDASRIENERVREWFAGTLRALGLSVQPSVGNFSLVRFPDAKAHDADAVFAYLKERGILTRKMGVYGLGHSLRITIGTMDDMIDVAEGVRQFLDGGGAP